MSFVYAASTLAWHLVYTEEVEFFSLDAWEMFKLPDSSRVTVTETD